MFSRLVGVIMNIFTLVKTTFFAFFCTTVLDASILSQKRKIGEELVGPATQRQRTEPNISGKPDVSISAILRRLAKKSAIAAPVRSAAEGAAHAVAGIGVEVDREAELKEAKVEVKEAKAEATVRPTFGPIYPVVSRGTFFSSAGSATSVQEIKGAVITLRPMQRSHYAGVYDMFSQLVRNGFEWPAGTGTYDDCVKYVNWQIAKSTTKQAITYSIFDNKDGVLIGDVSIIKDAENQGAKEAGQFSWWVNEKYWGGGRAQEALRLISRVYFEENPRKESFNAIVAPWNLRSQKALIKGGFRETDVMHRDKKGTISKMFFMYRDKI